MIRALAAAAVLSGLLVASTGANAVTIDISQAVLAGGANFIAGGSTIKFDPGTSGETATFALPSVLGQQYSLQVTGHNDNSSSFFNFFVDADGGGPGGFTQLGGNFKFSGFQTITLPSFTDLSTTDFFRIVNGGTGNAGGQITGLSINAVPGPIVGAGLPGLMMACGWLVFLARRRRKTI
jgi:hypothetical protein